MMRCPYCGYETEPTVRDAHGIPQCSQCGKAGSNSSFDCRPILGLRLRDSSGYWIHDTRLAEEK